MFFCAGLRFHWRFTLEQLDDVRVTCDKRDLKIPLLK